MIKQLLWLLILIPLIAHWYCFIRSLKIKFTSNRKIRERVLNKGCFDYDCIVSWTKLDTVIIYISSILMSVIVIVTSLLGGSGTLEIMSPSDCKPVCKNFYKDDLYTLKLDKAIKEGKTELTDAFLVQALCYFIITFVTWGVLITIVN